MIRARAKGTKPAGTKPISLPVSLPSGVSLPVSLPEKRGKGGRPALFGRAMTGAERKARWKAKQEGDKA